MFCVSIHLLWTLGRFHILSVADSVATNAHGQVFVWTDVVVDVLGRVETLSLTVSRTARLFCSGRPAFHSHQLCVRALTPPSWTLRAPLCLTLAVLEGVKCSHSGFDLCFPGDQ